MQLEDYHVCLRVYSLYEMVVASHLDDPLISILGDHERLYFEITFNQKRICDGYFTRYCVLLDSDAHQGSFRLNLNPTITFRSLLVFVVGQNMQRLLLARITLDKIRDYQTFLESAARSP